MNREVQTEKTMRAPARWLPKVVERLVAPALTAVAILALALPVYAAENGHEEGWGWLDPIGRWFNLLVLVGVIAYFAIPSMKRFFSGRAAEIKNEIQKADEDYRKALASAAEAEERVRRLDDELARIRKQAEDDAEVERRRILEQAEKDAEIGQEPFNSPVLISRRHIFSNL